MNSYKTRTLTGWSDLRSDWLTISLGFLYSFKNAYKAEAKTNPNFGKANGMDATAWWTNVSG